MNKIKYIEIFKDARAQPSRPFQLYPDIITQTFSILNEHLFFLRTSENVLQIRVHSFVIIHPNQGNALEMVI